MGHQHNHSHENKLSLVFWLNFLFSVIEVIGGLMTNSTAILADAFHDFADAMAIGLAVLLEKLSGKKRTEAFSYGYRRFSLISALVMSLFLLAGMVFMITGAIRSFIYPEVVESSGMFWLAVLGIAINGFAYLRMKKGDEHSHHLHAHDDTNLNSRAIMLHLLEDVLGWVAVLIGAVVIYFTGWYWIDGLLALSIAVFIGYNATKNLIATMKIFLQSVPESVSIENLSGELGEIQGVEDVHDLHVWSLDGSNHIGSLHAVVNTSDRNVENDIYHALLQVMNKYNIQHTTVQLETSARNCKWVNC